MERSTKRVSGTLLAVVLTVSMIGGVAVLAASGTVAADQHEPENAPTYNTTDGNVNFSINLPFKTDHYPGNQNQQNASIEYYAKGESAFTEQDAEEGLWLNIIIVEASWIDYSACTTSGNTAAFGIDRGANKSGTRSDESLLEHQSGSDLEAGGLTVYFYNWGAISGSPPYLSPQDQVVAAQGEGSNDGPCLTMTSEPGWYQLQAYTNGTIATKCKEEGNPDCEPDNKQWRGVNLNSNYVYICECQNEQEAREQLGPPPSEGGSSNGGSSTATPTPASNTPTPTQAPNTPTPTPVPDTPTPTQAQTQQNNGGGGGNNGGGGGSNNGGGGGGNNGGGGQATQTQGNAGGGGNANAADRGTPTISDGPGFTPVVALVALLAAALLVYRRQ